MTRADPAPQRPRPCRSELLRRPAGPSGEGARPGAAGATARRDRAGRKPERPCAGSRFGRLGAVLLALALLAGCNVPERLANVGRVPDLKPVEAPVARPDRQPVRMPVPAPETTVSAGPNSLWRSGARGFFRDQRARRVGDVVTVEITITDRAKIANETVRSRRNADDLGATDLFGLENRLVKVLRAPVDPTSLVNLDSAANHRGSGSIDRSETIRLRVAAVVTQVLPNGNLVIAGRQEVRVNYEVREVVVAGVVRPEDIAPDNSVSSERIAELRVGYGGRGQITDVQQPRWGAQVLDILLPY
ncbi:Flagellar L-ring protein [bacterium HR39]|nr:Flagellar L-ring protein [bacterium HR39]